MYTNETEQKEMERVASPEKVEKKSKKSKKLPKNSIEAMEDDQKFKTDGNASLERNHTEKDSDPEEPDFWTPPVGERWDFDDGKDRWESCTASDNDEEDGLGKENLTSCANLTFSSFTELCIVIFWLKFDSNHLTNILLILNLTFGNEQNLSKY